MGRRLPRPLECRGWPHHGRRWATALLLLAALRASPAGLGAAHAGAAPAKAIQLPDAGVLPRSQVVRRVVRGHESESYLLYVPAKAGPGSPVLVDAHGISRNVDEHARLLAPHAERYGVILVSPCFSREAHAGYQWFGREGTGLRSDRAVEVMLDDVASLTGADTGRCYLFGFSGGAQFVHRFALARPGRVARAVVAAAGWYTFPDTATPFPYGLGASEARADLRFDPERFLRVPMAVFVGGEDTGAESLRQNTELDRQQGRTRRDRASRWTSAMRRAAADRGLPPLVTCQEVPGIRHSFSQFMQEGGLGDLAFHALFGPPPPAELGTGRPSEARSGSH